MIISITFWPESFESWNVPITKIVHSDENLTNYYIAIGGINKKSAFEIPYYIIIPGIIGGYIRYIYKEIKENRTKFDSYITNLEKIYFKHTNKASKIAASLGTSITLLKSKISKNELNYDPNETFQIDIPSNETRPYSIDQSEINRQNKKIDENAKKQAEYEKNLVYEKIIVPSGLIREYVLTSIGSAFYLPNVAQLPFSKYLQKHLSELDKIELQYIKYLNKTSRYIANNTISVTGMFLLSPVLAVVAWLLARLGTATNTDSFVVLAFGAGLSADFIIRKIWSFTEDKLSKNGNNDDNDEENDDNDEENDDDNENQNQTMASILDKNKLSDKPLKKWTSEDFSKFVSGLLKPKN